MPPSRFLPRAAALCGACCLLLPLLASAQEKAELPANWPLPSPAPTGTNSAAYPMPRNEWMTHFSRDVDRARAAGQVDLVFDGDSITDGWSGGGKAVWAKNFEKYHPTDFGISADRIENLLWRLGHGELEKIRPKLIAVMIGTNNVGANTDDQIIEGIGAAVKEYQKRCPDAVVLLQGIFPRSEKPTDALRGRIKHINSEIAKLGDGKKVIFLDFGEKFLEPDGTISREIMADFLHPTAKGYEIWAEAILPTLEKVLGAP